LKYSNGADLILNSFYYLGWNGQVLEPSKITGKFQLLSCEIHEKPCFIYIPSTVALYLLINEFAFV